MIPHQEARPSTSYSNQLALGRALLSLPFDFAGDTDNDLLSREGSDVVSVVSKYYGNISLTEVFSERHLCTVL